MGGPAIRVGSRGSRLARVQVDEALRAIQPGFPEDTVFATTWFDTPGDRDRVTPLTDPAIPADYFSRDLDRALLDRTIDLTVHSAKDLPDPLPDGLTIAALLPARDIRDAVVLPAGADPSQPPRRIGTSSPRRAQAIRVLYPDAEPVEIRGDVPGRLEQLDRGDFDAVIVAACALDRLGFAQRIHAYLPGDAAPQQGRLALVVRADDTTLLHRLRPVDVRRNAGLVAIVGCPAEASLLSTRALQYLDHADLILHDRLLPDEILLRIRDRAETVGKKAGEPSIPQSEINRRMLVAAEQGKLVVRLQGGEPGLFGHLGEELEFLDAWNLRSDIVPALTAVQVLAAHGRASLTHRNRGRILTLLSGHPAENAAPIAMPPPDAGNLAVYMPTANRADIVADLLAAGWPEDTTVLLGERLGYKDERVSIHRLSAFPTVDCARPAVLLVGPHVHGPARTTLFVGTNPETFLKHGPLLHWPLIKLVASPLSERADCIRTRIDTFDGVLFPSRFSVTALLEALHEAGLDARALAGKKLLAVGPATADELRRHALIADLAAHTLGGVRDLATRLTAAFNGTYLYPCSDAAPTEQRVQALAPHGIRLEPVIFYTNRPMPPRALPRMPFQRVLFTSSSTVRVYFDQYPEERSASRTWIAVGPSTLEALESLGLDGELLPA